MKYEYKEETIFEDGYLNKLNMEGLEGWQVIRIEAGFSFGGYSAVKVLFMREIEKTKQEIDGE